MDSGTERPEKLDSQNAPLPRIADLPVNLKDETNGSHKVDWSKEDRGWAAASPALAEEARTRKIAARILHARRLGRDYFSRSLFADIGWEALLDLYVRERSGTSSSVASLQELSDTPISVLERWLKLLEADGMVRRSGFHSEIPGELIELTDKARDSLDRYLAAVEFESA